jgi:hypothetical protein
MISINWLEKMKLNIYWRSCFTHKAKKLTDRAFISRWMHDSLSL